MDIDQNIHPDALSRIVMLTYGPMLKGGSYWCYVAVRPTRYDEFQKSMAKKNYDLQKFETDGFGEVIVSGTGVTPPNEVTQKVANMFGIPINMLFKDNDPVKSLEDKMGVLIKRQEKLL